MSETLALVEQILDEHKQIHGSFEKLGQISSDSTAAAELGSQKTKDYFVSKSLDDKGEGLKRWKEMLAAIDLGLKAHFNREETALADAFRQEGTSDLAEALDKLLAEHNDINRHVSKLMKDAKDIASGGEKIEVWEGSGWGMKTNVETLRDEIMAHAERERVLLGRMKDHLQKS